MEHKSDNLEHLATSGSIKDLTITKEHSPVKLDKLAVGTPVPGKSTPSSENKPSYMEILGKKSLKVSLKIFEFTSLTQTVHVTQKLMDNLPTSSYRKNWDNHIPVDEGNLSDTTLIYWPLSEDSDTTLIYQPLSEDSDSDRVRLDISTVPSLRTSRKMPKFKINLHGLRRRKPKYWFRCQVKNCDSTFSTRRGWNFHHSYVHQKIILKCELCDCKFTSPSAHRAHKSAHVPRTNICTICDKAFPFKSGLRQHILVHKKQR